MHRFLGCPIRSRFTKPYSKAGKDNYKSIHAQILHCYAIEVACPQLSAMFLFRANVAQAHCRHLSDLETTPRVGQLWSLRFL